MRYRTAIAALAIATALAGCSTRPRNFTPQITAPTAGMASLEADYRTCATLVAQGRSSDFKGAAATMGAAGAGALGGAAVSVASVSALGFTGAGMVASAAIPGIGLLAGFGVSRMIRSGNERKFKRRMETCLGEYGYGIGDWSRIGRREDAAALAASGASLADPAIEADLEPVAAEAPVLESLPEGDAPALAESDT